MTRNQDSYELTWPSPAAIRRLGEWMEDLDGDRPRTECLYLLADEWAAQLVRECSEPAEPAKAGR